MDKIGDVAIEIHDHVALLEIQRPPNNFFDEDLINSLGDAFDLMDETPEVRALVLAAQGKHFCAGRNFASPETKRASEKRPEGWGNDLYSAAVRLFEARKPVVAAVQGAAVGGGFGLAVMPDFRVVSPQARFTANFAKLGFHPGFGLTHTLPRLIGQQKANLLFLTGRRINGETAYEWGLADILTDADSLRSRAMEFAAEIAENAPLALLSIRKTMREGLAQKVREQTDKEWEEQRWLQSTNDHQEGLKAVAERRVGNFTGT
ncbi:MAG: enoyl-CoA hydratase/isomerase family protein [Gammaproteobacteria bacterium]|nr:enoyl-CoA hydratase/isomerase family protein [Gammaproteobacteria bacterium]